ncbi:UNVERIFIED_CONTAM: hypothetical protein GTU68_010757 [Idotea baltica]|nr:hypothetical protein [Idotea baltica]
MIRKIIAGRNPRSWPNIGPDPQSAHVMGGFKIQGRQAEAVQTMIEDAKALQDAGCFSVVIEGVPDVAGRLVTEAIDIPTIGIGAGAGTDGQVLVYHDVIGLENRFKPKFVRRYDNAFETQTAALAQYAADVRSGAFPSEDETYHASEGLTDALGLYGSNNES